MTVSTTHYQRFLPAVYHAGSHEKIKKLTTLTMQYDPIILVTYSIAQVRDGCIATKACRHNVRVVLRDLRTIQALES